ncbi:hypothetical protein [Nocardioides yefusunii]|uniref:Uncharacterized protein n=1 Tax=Nocardioides yefusunii TaxID=2500546 RepID=A0ABW1QXE7_9ACTN|nr:hypothetical protein [Nocardioides yefusunii]
MDTSTLLHRITSTPLGVLLSSFLSLFGVVISPAPATAGSSRRPAVT